MTVKTVFIESNIVNTNSLKRFIQSLAGFESLEFKEIEQVGDFTILSLFDSSLDDTNINRLIQKLENLLQVKCELN